MKKTEILDTENCAELISGLILLARHYETAIDRSQDESERQKWFDRMEHAKELKRTLIELVRNRQFRKQLAASRQRIKGELR